ncbi:MAG: hypothetical protein ACN6N2_16325 [Acinetobacter calcoaceticus]
MTFNKFIFLISGFIVLSSIGCATNEPKENPLEVKPKDAYCNPSDAKKLIGQSLPSEEELKARTNASGTSFQYRSTCKGRLTL